jgi:hypothetical protein
VPAKDGEQVRLWARTTNDYSQAFARIRHAVAALPVESAVLGWPGEATPPYAGCAHYHGLLRRPFRKLSTPKGS